MHLRVRGRRTHKTRGGRTRSAPTGHSTGSPMRPRPMGRSSLRFTRETLTSVEQFGQGLPLRSTVPSISVPARIRYPHTPHIQKFLLLSGLSRRSCFLEQAGHRYPRLPFLSRTTWSSSDDSRPHPPHLGKGPRARTFSTLERITLSREGRALRLHNQSNTPIFLHQFRVISSTFLEYRF